MESRNDAAGAFEGGRRGLTRRQMLLGMGVGATALAAGMAGCASPQAPQPAEQGADAAPALKEPDQTVDADIVVVGSGMGGMSAAVTAAEEGASVILLEKQSVLGGGSNFAEGVFGMGSELQKEAGVNGSLTDLIKLSLIHI